MGRITIFSIEECNFCRRTKAALSARNIPYTDINIESYPSKRADMISLTDRLTVPQVFFNNEHIGGAEETLGTLAKWDEDIAKEGDECEDKTPRDRYVRLVESEEDPTDERLSIPTGSPVVQKIDLTAPRAKCTFDIGGKTYTIFEFTKLLVQRMPRESLTSYGCLYYNVCKGSSGVAALQSTFNLETKEEAIHLGMVLQRKNLLYSVAQRMHDFGDNGSYFRLQAFQSPKVLNSFIVWSEPVRVDPMLLLNRLAKMWSKLESKHLNEEGMVDHATLRCDDLYWKFEVEVCEIQRVNLKIMDDVERMAYIINLYNLMIKYAFVKVGIPATNSTRATFFDDVSVNVGGDIFSFNDLEHGILRANTRHPYQLTKRFGAMSSRKQFALKVLDSRVHFALNCGAKSCPPVKKFTADAIDEELRIAAMAFCEDESNVAIDEEKMELHLNKILYWYQSDFARSKSELPEKVLQYLRGEKKELLNKLIQQGDLSVKFLDYDWSSNNTNAITFEKMNLSCQSTIPYPRNCPAERYEHVISAH